MASGPIRPSLEQAVAINMMTKEARRIEGRRSGDRILAAELLPSSMLVPLAVNIEMSPFK